MRRARDLDEAAVNARPKGRGLPGRVSFVSLAAVICACSAPEAPALDTGIERADSVVRAWVDEERIPGAVLLVSSRGEVEVHEAYGQAQLYSFGDPSPVRLAQPVPMTTETVFDVASVTKVMATTMAVMLLVDRGVLDVDAPVSRYLPDFTGGGMEEVTLRHLLTHRSGLSQWQPTYYHASSSEEVYEYLRQLPLAWPVGAERHYSDLGFMLLGMVVEATSERGLDDFVNTELYRPLGLARTGFRPLDWLGDASPSSFAATSHGNPFERRMVHDPDFGYTIEGDPDSWDGWRRYSLSGEVNDGNAFHAFSGVAGHAGLFSTANDLSRLLELLLSRGAYEGQQLLTSETIDLFLTSTGDGQALGWQLPAYAPDGAFGHTGFTGTFVLGWPEEELAIVLLTNRQNVGVDGETGYPDVDPLRRAVVAAVTQR